eukprot:Platyproteum_vivax@DN9258_c0_g1_i1.p1
MFVYVCVVTRSYSIYICDYCEREWLLMIQGAACEKIHPNSNSAVQPDMSESAMTDAVLANAGMLQLFQSLLAFHHRGVRQQTLAVLGQIAAGERPHTEFVAELITDLSTVLCGKDAFDVKRESAVVFLHVAFNHSGQHLEKVLGAQPPMLDGILDLFETCKFDNMTMMVALDFVENLLACHPQLRFELYEKDILEKLENVESHHHNLGHRVDFLVNRYFQDIEKDM